MNSVLNEILLSRLQELESRSVLLNSVFQDPLGHNILHCFNIQPNKYVFYNELTQKNSCFRRILFWNCQGWVSIQGVIEKFLLDFGTDILGLCEIFLDENSANKIDVKENQFFHKNRTQQKHSGLAVLIKIIFLHK
jgi:hypothetical protein